MKLADAFKLSLNNIAHRRLRAWLTLLGIVIGVAAVVSIISIGDGATANVEKQLSRFGADIITISPGFSRAGTFGNFRGGFGGGGEVGGGGGRATSTSTPELKLQDVTIVKGNPNIIAVNQIVSGRAEVAFLSQSISASIQGVNPLAWAQTNDIQLAAGRLLTSSDSSSIVIGDGLANKTFKIPVTLGRTLDINGQGFIVVGILAPTTGGGGGSDNIVYMNYLSAWKAVDKNVGTFSSIQAKASDPELVNDTVSQLTESLMLERKVTANNQDFSITSSEALKQQVASVTQTLTLFLGAIAAISLLVGAIGIANSMFTSVLEKTREIGIMKALGSTDSEILQLFIIESALFGLIGGIIGAVIGTIASSAISLAGLGIGLGPGTGGGFSTLVTPQLLILAVLLSTVIGVVSGVLPARSASKLKPIEALRYE